MNSHMYAAFGLLVSTGLLVYAWERKAPLGLFIVGAFGFVVSIFSLM